MKPAYKYISQTKLGTTTNSLYRYIMTELSDVGMTRRHEIHVTTRLTLVNIELKLKQKGCRAILYDNYIRVLSGTLTTITAAHQEPPGGPLNTPTNQPTTNGETLNTTPRRDNTHHPPKAAQR